jgi:DNA-binding NarL/FixJ family response regulator
MKKRAAGQPEKETARDGLPEILPPAGTLLESISRDERERAIFRSRRMFQTDLESNLATARRNGILIGEKRGAERVKKQWDADKKQWNAVKKQWDADKEATRQETVRKMKAKGISVEVIADVMNLTPDEVRKLDKQKKR